MNRIPEALAIGTGIAVAAFSCAWVTILPTLGLLWLFGALK